ncbi:MAG: porin [Parvularcula sp.]|nr:porin [Parvularcula sp.]
MLRSLSISAALLAATPVWAQDEIIVVEGDAVITAGAADGEAVSDFDGKLSAKTQTEIGGLELGAAAGVRFDGDQPNNRAAGGRYTSLTTGGMRGVGPEDSDIYLDHAYLFARGGFGSFSLGAQEGAAARLAVTSPTIFRALGVNDWRADPTGLNDVHTVNDFSGNAAKLTYMPPPGFLGGAIGNLQLGVSYAPSMDVCEDDCAPLGGFAVTQDGQVVPNDQRWRDVSEAAFYYQNGVSIGGDRLLLGVGASFVRAEEEQPSFSETDFIENYQALALGLNLAYGDFTIGGSVKSTNAGLDENALGESDYLAFDAGITYSAGDWRMMLGYGQADAERDASLLVGPPVDVTVPFALDRRTQTAQAGVAYVLGRGVTLGAAAQYVDSDQPGMMGGKRDAAAVMIESSIRF